MLLVRSLMKGNTGYYVGAILSTLGMVVINYITPCCSPWCWTACWARRNPTGRGS